MFTKQWDNLGSEEKFILANGLLNPILKRVLHARIDELNAEIVNLNIPSNWSHDTLVTFAKEFQRRREARLQAESFLALIDQAQTQLQEMNTHGNV